MQARGTFVLLSVEPLQQKEGLLRTAEHQSTVRYNPARVVSVGDQVDHETLKPGDRIVFDNAQGTEVRIDGKTYKVLDQRQCAFKLEEDEIFG